MRWFENHKKATTIGLIIFVLLIIIAVSYGNSGSSSSLGRGIKTVTTTIQKPFAKVGEGINTAFRGIVQFRSVVRENEQLKNEVAGLNDEIIRIKLTRDELAQLQSLAESLNYESIKASYNYVTCDVISMDGSNIFNLFTINRGTSDGIKKDDVVISGQGLIGRVMEVGPNWAKVISIIDEETSVSFKSVRDSNLIGVMAGDGKGGLSGYMLSPDFMILKGDQLITTGMGMFPEGIPIGKVVHVTLDDDSLLKTIKIEPYAYVKSIQKVTVLVPKS